jgi:dUTPase
MKVKIKKFNDKAVMPYKHHEDDYCYDVVATSCEEIAPNVYKYGIGLGFEIINPYKMENLAIDFRPRSSVWRTGLVLSNCVGTIDLSYRGEVSAVFYKV